MGNLGDVEPEGTKWQKAGEISKKKHKPSVIGLCYVLENITSISNNKPTSHHITRSILV